MGSTRAAYGAKAICSLCSASFTAYRRSAKYCSEACKQRAKRAKPPQVAAAIGADPRDDEDLAERLHLAELERDIWEKTFRAAMQVLNPGKR